MISTHSGASDTSDELKAVHFKVEFHTQWEKKKTRVSETSTAFNKALKVPLGISLPKFSNILSIECYVFPIRIHHVDFLVFMW